MKQLGTITLPDTLEWVDRYGASPVTQTVLRTLSGTPVVRGIYLPGGHPITLFADPNNAWLDQTTVTDLAALAEQAGATFPLVWETVTRMVLFRHQEPPVLDLKPLWPNQLQYTGTIKLMWIE